EQIAVSRAKDKIRPQLERIVSESMLLEARRFCPRACFEVSAAQKVEQVPRSQFRSFVGDAIRINKQRKGDSRFFAKSKCVMHVAKPNRRQGGAGSLEFGLVVAQLRDMLAA